MAENTKPHSVRLTPEEGEDFLRLAAELGMNRNDLLKALVLWALKHRRLPTDEDAVPKTPPLQEPPPPRKKIRKKAEEEPPIPPPPFPMETILERLEILLRVEQGAGLMMLLGRFGFSEEDAAKAVRGLYLSGRLQDELRSSL